MGSLGGVELRQVGGGVGDHVRRRNRLRIARITLVNKRTSLVNWGGLDVQ